MPEKLLELSNKFFWQLKNKLGAKNVAQLAKFLPGLPKALGLKPRAPQTGYGCVPLLPQHSGELGQNSKVILSYIMSSRLVLATWDPVSQKPKHREIEVWSLKSEAVGNLREVESTHNAR